MTGAHATRRVPRVRAGEPRARQRHAGEVDLAVTSRSHRRHCEPNAPTSPTLTARRSPERTTRTAVRAATAASDGSAAAAASPAPETETVISGLREVEKPAVGRQQPAQHRDQRAPPCRDAGAGALQRRHDRRRRRSGVFRRLERPEPRRAHPGENCKVEISDADDRRRTGSAVREAGAAARAAGSARCRR